MTIKETLLEVFSNMHFTLKDAYEICKEHNRESVRARIYENLNIDFHKVARGVYSTYKGAILIEGDGRDISFLKDQSINCIITDHAWSDEKSNKGGSRNFAEYPTFKYTQEDFFEKARVLEDGAFLIEVVPAENANNFDYLYDIKKMAELAGFEYFSKVNWKKGTFVSNTGRKAKNTEEIMIFSKGKPKKLRLDVKKTKQMNDGNEYFMSGARKMLPTEFNYQQVSKNDKICQTEKPYQLFEEILTYFTFENDIVLDQCAGSGAVGFACSLNNRSSISIEILKDMCEKIQNRFKENNLSLLTLYQ